MSKSDATTVETLTREVAEKVKNLRSERGLSLDELATRCGVSRATLSQIETQRTNPTLAVLWKVATGLEVPFSELLGGGGGGEAVRVMPFGDTVIRSADGLLESRPLAPGRVMGAVDLYELTLAPGAVHESEAHPRGTREAVVVSSGEIEVEVAGERVRAGKRHTLTFAADVPHVYRNPTGRVARALNVIVYGR